MKADNTTLQPVLVLVVSTIGVASAIVFVKLSEVDATSTLMLRMFLAGGVATALAAWPSGKTGQVPPPARSSPIMYGLLLLCGVVSMVDMLSNHWAVKMTSVANTSILMNLSPVFVALLSWVFLREKIGAAKWLALALCIAGACLLVFDGNAALEFSKTSAVGDLLALNSALFYAIYLLMIKALRCNFSSNTIILWNSLTCAVLLVPLALATSRQYLPTTPTGWLVIALLALISQLLGHGLMAYALKYVDVVLASVSTLARPVGSILFGLFLFDERLALLQWLGVAAVLVGIGWFRRPAAVVKPLAESQGSEA